LDAWQPVILWRTLDTIETVDKVEAMMKGTVVASICMMCVPRGRTLVISILETQVYLPLMSLEDPDLRLVLHVRVPLHAFEPLGLRVPLADVKELMMLAVIGVRVQGMLRSLHARASHYRGVSSSR
jgi:hypothetical protein